MNRDTNCSIQRNVGQECVVGCGETLWVVEQSVEETEAAILD